MALVITEVTLYLGRLPPDQVVVLVGSLEDCSAALARAAAGSAAPHGVFSVAEAVDFPETAIMRITTSV